MSDQESKKPSKKTEQKAKPKQPSSAKKSKSKRVLYIAIMLIILFTLLFIGREVHDQMAEQTNVKAQLSGLQAQQGTQQQEIIDQQTKITRLLKLDRQRDADWVLAEADYLVHLAHLSLTFEHNVSGAIGLLEIANQQIGALSDPSLVNVRQALTNDITALKAADTADVENILLQLTSLGQQVVKLPVVSNDADAATEAVDDEQAKEQTGWRKGLQGSLDTLKSMVVVQYHEKPLGSFVVPTNRAYLDQHLHVLLAQAQWAVLHRSDTLYQQSLQAAANWVSNYYLAQSSKTQAMIAALNELAVVDISPEFPDLSDSVGAIQEAVEEQSSHKDNDVLEPSFMDEEVQS